MVDFLRPIFSRVLAPWIAWLALFLATKFGVVLDDSAQEKIVAGGVLLAIALFQTLYALAHRVIDRWVNPGDAASSHLARVEKDETAQLKALPR